MTKFHIMNGTLLRQTRGSDKIIFLYDEKGNKYGFDYNGTKYYYIFNVQGDVIGILNQAGQKIVSYTYDPWGKVLSVDGSEASTIGQINPIRYRGYYYDTETGFYYLQSRYYDPTTRRFLNADTAINAEGMPLEYNLFAYCLNNPVRYTDPTGYNPLILVAFAVPALFVVASVSSLLVLAQALPTDMHLPQINYEQIEAKQQSAALTTTILLYPVLSQVQQLANTVALGTALIQTQIINNSISQAISKSVAKSTDKILRNRNRYHYWAALYVDYGNDRGTFVATTPLVYSGAIAYARMGNNVFADSKQNAYRLALAAGNGRTPAGPFLHHDNNGSTIGYWWHYHATTIGYKQTEGHIFYVS